MRALLALICMLAALPSAAEEVVAGLSQNRISITSNFDGSEILIFGAVKREAPPPDAGPLQVLVAIEGPQERVVVRRKDRRFGIWINVEAVEVDRAPAFYAVATTGPFDDVISATEDLRHSVSIDKAIRSVGAPSDVTDPQAFTEALIRIRKASGQYSVQEDAVLLRDETLFNTAIELPANLTAGTYATRIFLTRDGGVIDVYETQINVQKVGLERFLYNLAHNQPLIYGLLSLAIAIAAGWGASAAFTLLRR